MDSNLNVVSDANGAFDCQPIVYPRCEDGSVRAADGSCTTASSLCYQQCGDEGGIFIDAVGVCECAGTRLLDEICDEDCRQEVTRLTCDSLGQVVVSDSANPSGDIVVEVGSDVLGNFRCIEESNVYYMTTTSPSGFVGMFNSGDALLSYEGNSSRLAASSSRTFIDSLEPRLFRIPSDMRRDLRQLANVTALEIVNPIMCLHRNDSVAFDVSNSIYPVYLKNSLLNTNPLFDYGPFRDLEAHAASATYVVSKFIFTFTEEGTYVFGLNIPSKQVLIVVVQRDNVDCPKYNQSQFLEFTDSNLIILGVTSEKNIVLSPDWGLLLGLLLGMLGVVLILIAFLYFFRRHAWETAMKSSPAYRKHDAKATKAKSSQGGFFKKNKVGIVNDDEIDKRDEMRLVEDVEKGLPLDDSFSDDNGPELSQQLQLFHDEIDRQIHIQNDALSTLQQTLVREVDELKNLLSSAAIQMRAETDSDVKFNKSDALLQQMRVDISSREQYENNITKAEAKVLQAMEYLQKLLRDGADAVAGTIVEEIELAAEEAEKRAADKFSRSPDAVQSELLHSMFVELRGIEEFVNGSLTSYVTEEKRRQASAESSFEQALKSSSVELSAQILRGIDECRDVERVADSRTQELLSAFTLFAARVPRVISALESNEKVVAGNIVDVIGVGNPAVLLQERNDGKDSFMVIVDQLRTALEQLLSKIDPTVRSIRQSRQACYSARADLIATIDEYRPQFALSNEKLLPLLRRLRSEGGDDADKEELRIRVAGSPRGVQRDTDAIEIRSKGAPFVPKMLSENAARLIQRSASLSELQKEDLMGQFESDVEVMQGIVERERQRQQDTLSAVMEMNSTHVVALSGKAEDAGAPAESEEAIAMRHAVERAELERTFRAEREEVLASLELTADSELDADIPGIARITSLLDAISVVRMKQLAFGTKLKFAEMEMQFLSESFSIQLNAWEDPEFCAANKTGRFLRLHGVLSNCEQNQIQSLDAAVRRMAVQRGDLQQSVLRRRSQWLASPQAVAGVDTAAELAILKREAAAEFAKLRERLSEISALRKATLEARRQVVAKASAAHASDVAAAKDAQAALGREAETAALREQGWAGDLRALESDVSAVISLALHRATPGASERDSRLSELREEALACVEYDTELNVRAVLAGMHSDAMFNQCRVLFESQSEADCSSAIEEVKQKSSDAAAQTIAEIRRNHDGLVKSEVDALEKAVNEFEIEAVGVMERCGLRSLRSHIQCQRYSRDRVAAVIRSLSEYSRSFINSLAADLTAGDEINQTYGVSSDIKKSILRMTEREEARCQTAILASFASIFAEMHVQRSHSLNLLDGRRPNTKFAEAVFEQYSSEELEAQRLVGCERLATAKFKAEVVMYFHFKVEVKRLITLGRTHDDLLGILEEIRALVERNSSYVDALVKQSESQLKSLIGDQLKTKLQIQRDYESRASAALSVYAAALKEALSSVPEGSVADDAASYAASSRINEAYRAYRKEMLSAFQSALNSEIRNGKMETEMRALLLQQSGLDIDLGDVLSYVLRTEIAVNFVSGGADALSRQQQRRREESESLLRHFEKELHGLLGELDHKKAKSTAFMKERLRLRRDQRVRELTAEGLSTSQATSVANKEMKQEEQRVIAEIEFGLQEEAKVLDAVSGDELDGLVRRIRKESETALQSLQEGFQAYSSRQHAALERKLMKRRTRRAKELIDQEHLSEDEAMKRADQELREEEDAARSKLHSVMKCFESDIQQKIDKTYEDNVKRIQRAQQMEDDQFFADLERRRAEVLSGCSEEKRDDVIQSFKDERRAREQESAAFVASQIAQMQADKQVMHDMLNVGIDAYSRSARETAAANGDLLEQQRVEQTINRNTVRLSACVAEIYDDIAANMRTDHEKSLRGLRSSLELRRQLMADQLRARLAARAKMREKDLAEGGMAAATARRRAEIEFGTLEEDLRALNAKIDEELAEALASVEKSKAAAQEEFDRYNEELTKIEDEESARALKAVLPGDTAALRNSSKSMNASEAKVFVDQVTQQIEARVNKIRSQCESEVTQLRLRHAKTMSAEELEELVGKKRKEYQKIEDDYVEEEFQKASDANDQNMRDALAARKQVELLRKQHEEEVARVKRRLALAHQEQKEALMHALAGRRAKRESQLAADRADAETRRKEMDRLAAKEEEEVAGLKRQQLQAEQSSILNLTMQHESKLSEAIRIAEEKERQANAAAMRESALAAQRDARRRAEAESARRELERMRAEHEKESSKRRGMSEAVHQKGKDRLADKLQRKKAQKEEELRRAEQQKLAILAAKQESEQRELLATRISQDSWLRRVRELSEQADKIGLAGVEKEGFIFRALLGNKEVPRDQYSAVINHVVGPRHSKETRDLLQRQFDDRISALKPAVAALLDTKNKSRVELLERLTSSGTKSAEAAAALAELDTMYLDKQQRLQDSVIASVESHHLEEQVSLRQRQLGEISAIIGLYGADLSTKEASDQVAQIEDYRSKLLAESAARQEKMNQERLAEEESMKKKHEERLREMEAELRLQEQAMQSDVNKAKQELLKQKVNLKKEVEEKTEELNKQDKQRILSEFEKEHEAALKSLENQRMDKKNKLNARLAAKRASVSGPGDGAAGPDSPRGAMPESPRRASEATIESGNRAEYLLRSVAGANGPRDSKAGPSSGVFSSEVTPAVSKALKLIEEKLDRIDKIVSVLDAAGGGGISNLLNPGSGAPYYDFSEPAAGDHLKVEPDESLSAQEMSRLRFARTIMGMFGQGNLQLKVASAILCSEEDRKNNAFRRSYSYDDESKTIYLHSKRLSSSGDVGLVITHAVSHIKVYR